MPKISDLPQSTALLEDQGASKSTQNLWQVIRQAVNSLWTSGPTTARPLNPLLGQITYDTNIPAFLGCTQTASSPHTNDAVWTPFAAGGGGTGTVTSITATPPIQVTPSPITTVGDVEHMDSGVVAATYGDATHVPQIAVSAKGHITSASNIAISGGGTVTSITATLPITVTPSPITGVGDIEHAASGVTAATYGDSHNVAQFTVNATGHVTAASNVAIVPGFTGWVFGDGSDGNVTISSGTTTLARDMFYNNLTISGTGSLNCNGWRVFVKGTLDLTNAPAAAIVAEGVVSGGAGRQDASGSSGGLGGVSVVAGTVGTYGSNLGVGGPNGSGAAAGSPGASNTGNTQGPGGNCGLHGGAGGSGTLGAGGTASTRSSFVQNREVRYLTLYLYSISPPMGTSAAQAMNFKIWLAGGSGAPSGASGSGDGAGHGGGGGGGGGQGGNVVFLAAFTINRGGSTAANAIRAQGLRGGVGGTTVNIGNIGGGGGGAGAGGGWIYLIYAFLAGSAATNCLSVDGGGGGNGGNGNGTGTGGDGGDGGDAGFIQVFDLASGILTSTAGTTGSSGTAHSGTGGGIGGAAGTNTINL